MTDVIFHKIQVAGTTTTSAVISSHDCTEVSACGSISFTGGEVTLLNDGYEVNPDNLVLADLTQAGFITSEFSRQITLENVQFRYNIIQGNSNANGALINLTQFS